MGKNKFKQPGGLAAADVTKKATTERPGASPGARPDPLVTSRVASRPKTPQTAKRKKAEASQAPDDSSLLGPNDEKLPFKLAIQPVKAKYGGMGLAKPSMFLDLTDAEFDGKFEELYYEHIKGWAGFSYTKSRKRQEQGQMLWKQRLNAKQGIQESLEKPAAPQMPKAKKLRRKA